MEFYICGCNSTVECQLPKLKVASSNLVTRSKTMSPSGLLKTEGFFSALPERMAGKIVYNTDNVFEKRGLRKYVGGISE